MMKTPQMTSAYGTAAVLVLMCVARSANGHGRLMEPPGRSSMWRFGFNTPKNYDDNALYCGGFQVSVDRLLMMLEPVRGAKEKKKHKFRISDFVCFFFFFFFYCKGSNVFWGVWL